MYAAIVNPGILIFSNVIGSSISAVNSRCNKNIDGVIRDFTSDTGACTFDRGTGLFTPTCEFVPDEESQAKASLMYAEYLTSVWQHSNLRLKQKRQYAF